MTTPSIPFAATGSVYQGTPWPQRAAVRLCDVPQADRVPPAPEARSDSDAYAIPMHFRDGLEPKFTMTPGKRWLISILGGLLCLVLMVVLDTVIYLMGARSDAALGSLASVSVLASFATGLAVYREVREP